MITSINISINTRNDAFVEDLPGEVESILKTVRARLDDGDYIRDKHMNLLDSNGNVTGTFVVNTEDGI